MGIQEDAAKIASNYGVQPSPQNINRIIQEMQSNPDLISQSMGLQGGASGEGGSGLGNKQLLLDSINKLAANTERSAPSIIREELPPPSMNPGNSPAPVAAGGGNGASPRGMPAPTRPTAHNEAAGSPLQQSGGIDVNRLITGSTNPNTAQILPGEAEGGGAPPEDSFKGMSAEAIALALGIPIAAAAIIKGSIDAVETTGKRNRIQGIKESVDLDNAKMRAALEAGQSPGAAVDAANKIATDTAGPAPKPAPATKPAPTTGPTKAAPRTAIPGVEVGPARDATVVDDGVAAAERAKSNAALKPAQNTAPVPPAKPTGPVSSIKDAPYTPIPKEVLPGGPVEPQGEMRRMLNDLIEALKKSKIKRAP